jgi:hypothetical protein
MRAEQQRDAQQRAMRRATHGAQAAHACACKRALARSRTSAAGRERALFAQRCNIWRDCVVGMYDSVKEHDEEARRSAPGRSARRSSSSAKQ